MLIHKCPVANNFWGKEDAGVTPLLSRMTAAKTTCDELRAFYGGKYTSVSYFEAVLLIFYSSSVD